MSGVWFCFPIDVLSRVLIHYICTHICTALTVLCRSHFLAHHDWSIMYNVCTLLVKLYFSSLPSASIYPDQEDMPRKKRTYGHPCTFIRNAIIVHNNIVHNNSCLFVSFIKYVLWAKYVPSCRCITSSLCF